MYPITYVREHADQVRRGLEDRFRPTDVVDRFLAVDARWKATTDELNRLRARRNAESRRIADSRKRDPAAPAASSDEVVRLRAEMDRLERLLAELDEERRQALLEIPQIPHPSVPRGRDASANVVVDTFRPKRSTIEHPRPHFEIAHELNLLDEERGAKVAGEGFYFLWGDLARLEHALLRFMRELHVARGYLECAPPIVVNSDSMFGTGQLPKFADDSYRVERDDLWLVPTAEVPVTNAFRDEVLLPDDLPLRLVAYTPCFRREASGHGVETRGIARVHQFDKVELVSLSRPESSYDELEVLRAEAEEVLRRLDLPYRVVNLSTGDLPDKAAKCYDLELWAPGSQRWLEVSSVSNFETYQATRARIRYRPVPGGPAEFVHTLNGSGTALARLVIAILENYQTEDGGIEIPEVLRPSFDGRTRLEATPWIGERELARGRRPASRSRPSPSPASPSPP